MYLTSQKEGTLDPLRCKRRLTTGSTSGGYGINQQCDTIPGLSSYPVWWCWKFPIDLTFTNPNPYYTEKKLTMLILWDIMGRKHYVFFKWWKCGGKWRRWWGAEFTGIHSQSGQGELTISTAWSLRSSIGNRFRSCTIVVFQSIFNVWGVTYNYSTLW